MGRSKSSVERSFRAWAGAAGAALLGVVVMACGSGFTSTVVPYSSGPEGPHDPASRGAEVYAESCAGCHGENGEGSEGRPKLVGADAIPVEPAPSAGARKTQMHSAQDLFAFLKSDMPPIAPGSLADDQYWAIVTYLVQANGADLHGQGVDAKSAPSIKIHR